MELKLKQKKNNNFVKIKASPFDLNRKGDEEVRANTRNMLDSLSSESSQHEISQFGLGYQQSIYEQSSGNLKFGCFPGKQPDS
jgi:hypothetical protein